MNRIRAADASPILPCQCQLGVSLLQIDLVGHSAGAIAICHFLAAARQTGGLVFRNVVLLAPACTCDLMHREIVLQPARYQRFRLFAMDDVLECADKLKPGFYNRSLLYLVSGILEDRPDTPLAGLHRHLLGNKPHDSELDLQVRDFLQAAGQDRLVLSTTAADAHQGLRCLARSHGGFGLDPATLDSLECLIRQ